MSTKDLSRTEGIVRRPIEKEAYQLLEAIDRWYSFDPAEVTDIERLCRRIVRAETIEDWSFILGDHIQQGGGKRNTKLAKNIEIFNMNSAHECPNLNTDHCQVPDGECYAYKGEYRNENDSGGPLSYRRRQQVIWDLLDAETFFEAYKLHYGRKFNEVDFFRWSQSGDFQSEADLHKAEYISRRMKEELNIQAYGYSASDYLNWSIAESFTVNRSNDRCDYGDSRYMAVTDPSEAPSDAVQCPYELSDGDIRCGECTLCMNPDSPDVFINLH